MGMLIGVAVGWELARELDDEPHPTPKETERGDPLPGPFLLRARSRATRACSSTRSSPATPRPPWRPPSSSPPTSSSPTATPTTRATSWTSPSAPAPSAWRSRSSRTSWATTGWRTSPTRTSAARSSSTAAGCGWCRPGTPRPRPGGTVNTPAGLVISLGGKIVYHLGDTALFSRPAPGGRARPLDAALMCIGGHYTMDRHDAVIAAELIGAPHRGPLPLRHLPADRDRRRGLQVRRRVADGRRGGGELDGRGARAGRDA